MDISDNTLKICEFCLAENELLDEIRLRGEIVEECLICHSLGGKALPANDPIVKRIFRALIRLNFSEWDYNQHIGGESLEFLVADSDKIFNLPPNFSLLDFEDAYLTLEDNWYPDHPEEISLGGGYWDGGILIGLRDRMNEDVTDILNKALSSNYFELQPLVTRLIEAIKSDLSLDIPSGSKFFRARLGVKLRLSKNDPVEIFPERHRHYLPFSGVDIDRPPIVNASEGRFNRTGVSILYLATDQNTAVAELKPHPGHLVSVAEFVCKRTIRVADFSNHDIRKFLSDDRLEDLRTILSIGAVLNLPVVPEHRALYILTNLFSDAIRKAGYEGISFRSTVGTGRNLTGFVSDAFEQVPNSESVLEVRALSYQLSQRKSVPQNYDIEEFVPDSEDMLSTLFDGLARNA